jgi:hypothetical protein
MERYKQKIDYLDWKACLGNYFEWKLMIKKIKKYIVYEAKHERLHA